MGSRSEKDLWIHRKLLSIGIVKGPEGSLLLFLLMKRLRRGFRRAEMHREIRMMNKLWLGDATPQSGP